MAGCHALSVQGVPVGAQAWPRHVWAGLVSCSVGLLGAYSHHRLWSLLGRKKEWGTNTWPDNQALITQERSNSEPGLENGSGLDPPHRRPMERKKPLKVSIQKWKAWIKLAGSSHHNKARGLVLRVSHQGKCSTALQKLKIAGLQRSPAPLGWQKLQHPARGGCAQCPGRGPGVSYRGQNGGWKKTLCVFSILGHPIGTLEIFGSPSRQMRSEWASEN
jgi:hypothetical protein